jgi:hypothetical protein
MPVRGNCVVVVRDVSTTTTTGVCVRACVSWHTSAYRAAALLRCVTGRRGLADDLREFMSQFGELSSVTRHGLRDYAVATFGAPRCLRAQAHTHRSNRPPPSR